MGFEDGKLTMKSEIRIRNRHVLLIDLIFVILSVFFSFFLRLELGAALYFYAPSAVCMILICLLIKPLVFYFFGLYRRLWIYASIQELKLIVISVTVASMLVSLVMITLFILGAFTGFPRSTLAIDWVLSLVMIGGSRFAIRILSENKPTNKDVNGLKQKQVVIVGAGDAGALVVRELQKNPQLNMKPIGFLDDASTKQNQQIYGIRVIGRLPDLSAILEKQPVDEVIIAIPSAPGSVVRLVADICRLKDTPFRTMPGIYELIGGNVNVNRLREVDIADLLRREPVQVQNDLLGKTLHAKKVLVTGGGGSIGKELCRQIALQAPSELVLLGHGENSIFEAVLDLREAFPSLFIKPVIADLRDVERIRQIFEHNKPNVIFHAAAHKHVPLMEINIEDAISNNILGTKNIVNAALAAQVERLVMISTDKAVRPSNVYGATKRLAEMIVLDAADRFGKAYSVVRFGNVLGSRGSVVPIFKRQIASGGPITITHPDMERYFMTIPEAVNLVLHAASIGIGNETFVLNMGKQVRILDLAEDLIRLSGLAPWKDIEIVFTGIRPGEKLSEDLWDDGFNIQPTSHPEIFCHVCDENLKGEILQNTMDLLTKLVKTGDTQAIIESLNQCVPGATINTIQPPEITAI